MPKYDISDYMPKDHSEAGKESLMSSETASEPLNNPVDAVDNDNLVIENEPRTMEPLDLTPEQKNTEQSQEAPEKQQCVHVPLWSRYVSAFFSPLLIATYTVAITMWITPLSEVPERPRFSATLMIFLITAIAPMAYILTMVRMGRIGSVDIPTRRSRFGPALISIICLVLGVFYLNQVRAPEWLAITPAVYAVSTIVFILLNFCHMVSGHAMNMGTMTGVLLYLGVNNYIDITVSSVVGVSIVLTGLVCSARIAVGRHNIADVAIGAASGLITGYAVMLIACL